MSQVDEAAQRIADRRAGHDAAVDASQRPDPNVERLAQAQQAIYDSQARSERAYGPVGTRPALMPVPRLSKYAHDYVALTIGPDQGLVASFLLKSMLSNEKAMLLLVEVLGDVPGATESLRRHLCK